MNLTNERKLAARAKALGEAASAAAFPELADLARSESPLVRRLAASAIGKLAGIVDSMASARKKVLSAVAGRTILHPEVQEIRGPLEVSLDGS